MAQTFTSGSPDSSTNILQDNINSRVNEETLRSTFSGTSFPTSPTPVAGQKCFRMDLKQVYEYDGANWVEEGSNSSIASKVETARGCLTTLGDR